MADAAAEALAAVDAHLVKSTACAREGTALLDRAVELRAQAYDLLPVGVQLRFDTDLWDYVVEKRENGWVRVTESPMEIEDDWVRENWERHNWVILAEDERV